MDASTLNFLFYFSIWYSIGIATAIVGEWSEFLIEKSTFYSLTVRKAARLIVVALAGPFFFIAFLGYLITALSGSILSKIKSEKIIFKYERKK